MRSCREIVVMLLSGLSAHQGACVRQQIREQVHTHRNQAQAAISSSRIAMKASERAQRVAETTIKQLEKTTPSVADANEAIALILGRKHNES